MKTNIAESLLLILTYFSDNDCINPEFAGVTLDFRHIADVDSDMQMCVMRILYELTCILGRLCFYLLAWKTTS